MYILCARCLLILICDLFYFLLETDFDCFRKQLLEWINDCSKGGEEQEKLKKFRQEMKEYLTKKETFKRAIALTFVIQFSSYYYHIG